MAKPGRKKITSALGEKKLFCCWCYPIEYNQLKIEYAKLKRLRPKYIIKEEQNDKTGE